ncbi:hypothetical protein OAS86_02715 [Gammaproteobacteria bacterium]|nr:hypothetical protein [Gammaproteobacteria bacterium]
MTDIARSEHVHHHDEMGYSRAEFLGMLSAALRGYDYRLEGNRISIDHPAGRLRIDFGPEGQRQIALLTLPTLDVRFEAELPPDEWRAFKARFDLAMRRGGG